MNSFAMIMFLCVCGSSLHASSSLLTIYILCCLSHPYNLTLKVHDQLFSGG